MRLFFLSLLCLKLLGYECSLSGNFSTLSSEQENRLDVRFIDLCRSDFQPSNIWRIIDWIENSNHDVIVIKNPNSEVKSYFQRNPSRSYCFVYTPKAIIDTILLSRYEIKNCRITISRGMTHPKKGNSDFLLCSNTKQEGKENNIQRYFDLKGEMSVRGESCITGELGITSKDSQDDEELDIGLKAEIRRNKEGEVDGSISFHERYRW